MISLNVCHTNQRTCKHAIFATVVFENISMVLLDIKGSN